MNNTKCVKCGKDFKNKYNLERHLKRQKPCDQLKDLNKKIFKCDICLKDFSSNDRLKYHKNKKIPCKPIIEILAEENLQLKMQINNITTNNNDDEVKKLKNQIENLTSKLQNNITLNTGLIYLIQPEELIGTYRYKFGYSEECSLKRIKSYGSKVKIYLTYSSDKAKELESHILKLLSEKYVKIKNEYFEIDDICNVKKCILNECLNFD